MLDLLIPCILYRMGRKTFLLDAYFMGKVENPARNALFVYPPEGLATEWEKALKLNSRVAGAEAENILWKAQGYIKKKIVDKSVGILKKYRLSLLFPTKPFEKLKLINRDREIEYWELTGAERILKVVLDNKGKSADYKEIVFLKASIDIVDNTLRIKASNDIMGKNYRWLFEHDVHFRKEIYGLLRKSPSSH